MRNIFLVLALGLLISCKKDVKVPDRLLTKEEMVPFMIDIHLAEAKVKVLKLKHDTSQAIFRILENDIYEKHQISDSIYLESYNFYMQHPVLMEEIYQTVIDSLSLREKLKRID